VTDVDGRDVDKEPGDPQRIVPLQESPDPGQYYPIEVFVAGAISTLPMFAHDHPAYCLPIARRAIDALGEYVSDDAG
jgi:hypothetical protein